MSTMETVFPGNCTVYSVHKGKQRLRAFSVRGLISLMLPFFLSLRPCLRSLVSVTFAKFVGIQDFAIIRCSWYFSAWPKGGKGAIIMRCHRWYMIVHTLSPQRGHIFVVIGTDLNETRAIELLIIFLVDCQRLKNRFIFV